MAPLAAWPLMVLAAGCSPRLCVSEVPTSGQVTASLIDTYGPGGRFLTRPGDGAANPSVQANCAGSDGITAGGSLSLRITGQASDRNHTCNYVVAELVSPPAGLTVVGPTSNQEAILMTERNEGLYVTADVKTATCEGTMVILLFPGGAAGGLFSEPKDGDLPPAILYRLFLPSKGPCQPCQDNFTASLTKS